MRKTLIIALAGMLSVEANAATPMTYTATEAGTTVSLPDDAISEEAKEAIQTKDDANYSIKYASGATSGTSIEFNITKQIYIQGVSESSNGKYITSRALNITDNAGLTASGAIQFMRGVDKTASYTVNVTLGDNAFIKAGTTLTLAGGGATTTSLTLGNASSISAGKSITFSSTETADISINFGTAGTATQSAITTSSTDGTDYVNLVSTVSGGIMSSLKLTATLTEDELTALTNSGKVVNREIISSSQIKGQITDANTTLTLSNLSGKADGGVLVMLVEDGNTSYYKLSDTTYSNDTYSINDGAQAVTLADNTAYTYIEIGSNSGAKATTIGMLVTPEPATATLSLLALAGLCARRRRR